MRRVSINGIFLSEVPEGGVHSATPDGYYLDDKGDRKQVIIIGPMNVRPGDFEVLFDGFRVVSVETMVPPKDATWCPPEARDAILRRGFYSVILETMNLSKV